MYEVYNFLCGQPANIFGSDVKIFSYLAEKFTSLVYVAVTAHDCQCYRRDRKKIGPNFFTPICFVIPWTIIFLSFFVMPSVIHGIPCETKFMTAVAFFNDSELNIKCLRRLITSFDFQSSLSII